MTYPSTQLALHYRERVDSYWADFLGCAPESLYRYGDTIVHHETSDGLFCLEIGDSRVLSLAPGISITPPYGPLSREWIFSTLMCAGAVHEIYGPGDLFYCTPCTFRPIDNTSCQPLKDANREELERFARAAQWQCALKNQVYSWDYAFGIYHDSELVSAATIIIWGETIAALKVATLPEYRGRGYGSAVTSAVTRAILNETHLIPQYDTATSNHYSQRIAEALGFKRYGQIYYGKLR